LENYSAVWKTLEELTTVLVENGVKVSGSTMSRLRSTRATINIYEADPTYGDTVELIEGTLSELEAELVTLAEIEVGEEFANEWMERISKAGREDLEGREVSKQFISGIPRRDYWIRFRIGDTIPGEELREMAMNRGLSIKDQEPGFIIVHGEREKVRELVRGITEKMKRERG